MKLSTLINLASKNFGSLYTGNCGTFALALYRVMLERGYKAELVAIAQSDTTDDDLHAAEAEVYHFYVKVGNKWIDGLGVFHSKKAMMKSLTGTIATCLKKDNAAVFIFDHDEINPVFVLNVIHGNTDYDTHEDIFQEWIVKTLNGQKIELD